MEKPKMIFNFRISIDSAGHQRYTEEQIKLEINNENVKFARTLLVRKSDGAVMGEFLL